MTHEPDEMWRHLPLATPDRAEAARQEATELEALSDAPSGQRIGYYLKKSGPGWMQSAMTLGGGSAIASLSLGASFGFELLWVQPLAMLAGIVMLAAHAHQTLSTGVRPFHAMREHVHPVLAWMWVGATLVSTLVWDFPQFALASGMVEDMVQAITGWRPAGSGRSLYLLGISILLFAGCTGVVWNYNRGLWGIRFFDHFLKGLIWLILLCFLIVILRAAFAGGIDWLALKTYVALPTSAICGVLLPIAYIGWFLLHNSSSFLGDDRPRGRKALLWNTGMLVAVLLAAASSLYYLSSHF
jgi:manganese transport protein